MMNKLWILSELFYPDQTSTGYIMTEIAESLAANKPVNVICGPEGYTTGNTHAGRELNSNIHIERVKTGNWDKDKVVPRIIRMIILTIKMSFKIYSNVRQGDKVIMVTNPAPLLLLIGKICKYKKAELIIIVHDVFPENLGAAKMINKKGPVYKLLLSLFNTAYSTANLLIVLGRDMRDIMAVKTHLSAQKIIVIENWADIENIYPLEGALGGPVKLQFAGNFGRVQGLMQLLEAIDLASNKQMVVEFIGSGAVNSNMKAYISDQQVLNVKILPPFNRGQQLEVLNNCDISIVSLAPGMAGLGVPSKAYNILAAGKPILFIGDMHSEIALLIKEYNIGWAYPDFDEELISFLKNINAGLRADIKEKGFRARQLAEQKYAKSIILENYKNAIESV